MPNPMIALVGGSVGSAVVQSNSAKKASRAQVQAADKGIAEQKRQFDAMQKLLTPYVEAGETALGGQMALGGMSGADAQAKAIASIEGGAEFGAMTRQGEEAILQNASATGGLRGGNTQGALAQFRPQVLSSLINQQYNRLGGLAASGQNAAANVGAAGMQTGQAVSNLYGQQGAAVAGAQMARGQAFGNALGSMGTLAGRGMAYQGFTPEGASAPLSFSQGMFYGGGKF